MEISLPPLGAYLRPALILVCGMLLFNLPTLIYKSQMFLRSIAYLIFCNDKSWKKPSDPNTVVGPLLKEAPTIERKTIYFVRHGESTWNDTFHKGSRRTTQTFALGFVTGLIKATLCELYLILSGKLDSWFYDAPLSKVGLQQAQELSKFLQQMPASDKENFHRSVLNAEPGSPASKLICSNLRRAVSTLAAAFRDRLSRRPQEKILIIPALQEIRCVRQRRLIRRWAVLFDLF
jgi:broad specificity phosphatase PhoE